MDGRIANIIKIAQKSYNDCLNVMKESWNLKNIMLKEKSQKIKTVENKLFECWSNNPIFIKNYRDKRWFNEGKYRITERE